MFMHLRMIELALTAMNVTYRHWESWKDDENPGSRLLAIKAKTYGIITYDRIMLGSCRGR